MIQELEAAGLVLVGKDPDGDGRRNVYTLAGAGSAWAVAIPLVPFRRHEFYALQYRIARLEGLLESCSPVENRGLETEAE